MKELLHQLVKDSLLYLKDPLYPKHPLFATKEELLIFKTGSVVKPSPLEKPVSEPVDYKKPEPPLKKPVSEPSPVVAPPPSHIKETLSKLVPGLRLVDHVPDDEEGKKKASAWKEKTLDAEVVLLACRQDESTLEFLKGLAKAIDKHLAKTKILPVEKLEREKQWELFLQKNAFTLILASEGFEQLRELQRFYKKEPLQNRCFLDKILFFPLLPTDHYKNLENKALLWKTLCQTLKK